MTLFKRSLCLSLSLLLSGMIYNDAVAGIFGRSKREKSVNSTAESQPESMLMGMDTDQVKARLGVPSLKRSEGGAEVWQYVQGGCVLNLFLYATAQKEGLRVQYLDVYAATRKAGVAPSPLERQNCLQVFTGSPVPAK